MSLKKKNKKSFSHFKDLKILNQRFYELQPASRFFFFFFNFKTHPRVLSYNKNITPLHLKQNKRTHTALEAKRRDNRYCCWRTISWNFCYGRDNEAHDVADGEDGSCYFLDVSWRGRSRFCGDEELLEVAWSWSETEPLLAMGITGYDSAGGAEKVTPLEGGAVMAAVGRSFSVAGTVENEMKAEENPSRMLSTNHHDWEESLAAKAAHGWSYWSGWGTQPLLLTAEKMIDVVLGKWMSLLSGAAAGVHIAGLRNFSLNGGWNLKELSLDWEGKDLAAATGLRWWRSCWNWCGLWWSNPPVLCLVVQANFSIVQTKWGSWSMSVEWSLHILPRTLWNNLKHNPA